MRFAKLAGFCSLLLWSAASLSQVHAQNTAPDGLAGKAPEGMVYIPGGPFIMGTDEEDHNTDHTIRAYSDANPRHNVNVAAFYMDKLEVTNVQYKQFCDATHYPPPPHWLTGTYPDGEGNLPVYNVDWWEASAYAAWAGKRLPTEAEWEKAARGTDGRTYPWGEDWDNSRTVADAKKPEPVGSHPTGASPYGVLDMAGNVMEWVSDWYAAYPGALHTFPEFGTTHKVVRGGGFNHGEALYRTYYRCVARPQTRSDWIGFRCAKSA
ncbi:MAG: SUMF1/EgtB/PvdO family nonheme iron enzyme [Abitibacteriaceae bacterium]|nr:SUMF1/EgtB/PvdO family nonheme iron enzyme [Abditibacteriaceae bacterium]MBV9864147.1 SUMF1/EgtB/PvdO family nonheme iron enzyme [Abditibacteriaceae bacterium]